jgi:hypothetical protein
MANLATVSILTNASGDFSTTIACPGGKLLQYRYVVDPSIPLATGASITVSGATSGFAYIAQTNIGTSSFTKAPRYPTHDSAGAALLYASGGTPASDAAFIGGEQLNVVVAAGGNAKAGKLYIWTE